MTPLLLPAVAGALVVAGLIGLVIGVRKAPPRPPAPPRSHPALARLTRVSARTRGLLLAGLAAGMVVAALTGWWVAALVLPAAAAGLPVLLSAPASAARIDRLEAMEEWTRALSGVLTVGVGLEQALVSTLRSTPDPIRRRGHHPGLPAARPVGHRGRAARVRRRPRRRHRRRHRRQPHPRRPPARLRPGQRPGGPGRVRRR